MNPPEYLMTILIVAIITDIVLSIVVLTVSLSSFSRSEGVRKAANDLMTRVDSLLSLVKGYEQMERVHKESAKDTLSKVERGVETISNAINETRQVAESMNANVMSDQDRLRQINKMKEVLERRISRTKNTPTELDDSGLSLFTG